MKNISFSSLLFCTANAQNGVKIEYYLDTDPGFGLATDVPVLAGTPIILPHKTDF